jgi:acetyl-CoA decarbonylase/synthase, CODH/ACS complex subunit beta
MLTQAIGELLNRWPNQPGHFDGSEYPLPIKTTFLGDHKIDLQLLHQELIDHQDSDVKDILEPILLAAEIYEASCKDKEQYFITDRQLHSYVFTGSKWKAGWVLILGGEDQRELIEKLQEKDFMVFTDTPDIDNTCYIGNRDTSPIYFLQMMVRYGLIWGSIAPGDDHEMGHFLEKDLPGFVMICQDLSPLKYLIALGLMKLGAPAVVPSTFPFPYGNCVVADNINEMIGKGIQFSNLRLRYYKDEIISLPSFCNPAFAHEKITDGRLFGGSVNSFFCVKPTKQVTKELDVFGTLLDEIGILVEIEDEKFSADLALIIEQTALKSINFLAGINAYEKDGKFFLEMQRGIELNPGQIRDAIFWGIRMHYPRLEKIKITIIYQHDQLVEEAQEVNRYKTTRQLLVENMTEENTEDFCVCIECRPFSLVHTCILTPDRLPMCASRTYLSTKASSYFGFSSHIPFQRQSESELPLKEIFQKGKILDAVRGEYEGCNKIYQDLTMGKLNRVFLHSLRGFPHTSCGCFQNLAFWIEEVKGIGIMSRNSKAVAPNGQTWDLLANHAGGKQSDGITGVSRDYIGSKNFLKGDGGIGNVVWVDSELVTKIEAYFLSNQRVATEKDVNTIEELRLFSGRDF